jgi:Flp pilus assembly pilin Flp
MPSRFRTTRSTTGQVARRLVRDQRGAVMMEYSVVLLTVSLMMAVALTALGVPLFSLYSYTEFILGLPVP